MHRTKKRHKITRLIQELQELLAKLIKRKIRRKKDARTLHFTKVSYSQKNSEKQIKWTFRNSAILLSEMFNSSDSKVNLIKCEHFET